MFASLRRLQEEDPTIDLHRDPQTGEQIVAGLSQVHVEVIVDRLRQRFGVEVSLKPPRVPYQETIRAAAKAHGRHKKQSGGRGQFGDCHIEIEPLGEDGVRRPRPPRLRVRRPIKGGVIPSSFIPAVEKGVREAMDSWDARRLSRQGRARHALRRLLPRRGLLGDRLQAGRRRRDARGARAGRPGAAGADHAGHRVGARGVRGRRDRRSQQPPRPPARDGAGRRDAPRSRPRRRWPRCSATPPTCARSPAGGRLHAGVPALRGGPGAPRAEARRAGRRSSAPPRTPEPRRRRGARRPRAHRRSCPRTRPRGRSQNDC